MNTIKVISLNVENHKHIDRVIPLLKKEKPDIILLQELYQDNVAFYENELHVKGVFAPHCLKSNANLWGTGTFTAHTIISSNIDYYDGDKNNIPVYNNDHPELQAKALLQVTIEVANQQYTFLNTHFTWTPNGQPSPKQENDLISLLAKLKNLPEFILMGDFNAPRGGRVFDHIAELYKDNIPPEITTTIDKNYHRAGDLQYMVDGCFSTPQYLVTNVRIVDGVSDHFAIIAEIGKV